MENEALIQRPPDRVIGLEDDLDKAPPCSPLSTPVRLLLGVFVSGTIVVGTFWLLANIAAFDLSLNLPKEIDGHATAISGLKDTISSTAVESLSWYATGVAVVALVARNRNRSARYEWVLIWLVSVVGISVLSSLLLARTSITLVSLKGLGLTKQREFEMALVEMVVRWSSLSWYIGGVCSLLLSGIMAYSDGALSFVNLMNRPSSEESGGES